MRILIINTGVPRSTKKMVAGVKDKYNKVKISVRFEGVVCFGL